MKRLLKVIFLVFVIASNTKGQTVEELYSQKDYKKLIEYADSTSLTKDQCYYIGYAYFQLEDDKNAIRMYDQAIKKGLNDDYIYLYKGLSLRYDKQYDKAIDNFRIAINRNPKGQKNYNELANVYYFTNRYDSALFYFYKARNLTYELGDPYDKIPLIYHIQEKFDKALEEYKTSASLIDKEDPIYIELLKNIGLLEYTHTKNFKNSIKAYTEVISIIPKAYDLYPKLIKAHYANEDYSRGDSIFNILKVKYDNKELSKDLMEMRGVTVDEFLWNGHRVSSKKYFDAPKEFADPIFQFFLLDKEGSKVVKKVLTEKTSVEIENTKHVLCSIDKETGSHSTYSIGWSTDEINYKELKGYVIKIFEEKIKPIATTNSEQITDKKKRK